MVFRKPRREKRELTRAHADVLLTGRTHIVARASGFYRADAKLIMPAVEAAWNEVRDEILPRYVLENPGRRPWAWWIFDAPEPTRRLHGGFDAFAKGPRANLIDEILRFGCGWYTSVGIDEMADPPIVETEAGYLERHGLLTDHERDVLGPDFPREEAMCAQEVVKR
jgi:hypothetical protein